MTRGELQHGQNNDEVGPPQELLDTEHKYGGVRIMYHDDAVGNKWIKIHFACPNCTHERNNMGNMKTDVSWRNELKNRYDLFTLSVNPRTLRTHRNIKQTHTQQTPPRY